MGPEAHRTPVYEQIAQQIRERILSGDLADGDPAPSMPELEADWSVSVITARRAIQVLEEQGFVISRPGRPAVVARALEAPCPDWAAADLGVEPGAMIWHQPIDGTVILRRIVG